MNPGLVAFARVSLDGRQPSTEDRVAAMLIGHERVVGLSAEEDEERLMRIAIRESAAESRRGATSRASQCLLHLAAAQSQRLARDNTEHWLHASRRENFHAAEPHAIQGLNVFRWSSWLRLVITPNRATLLGLASPSMSREQATWDVWRRCLVTVSIIVSEPHQADGAFIAKLPMPGLSV